MFVSRLPPDILWRASLDGIDLSPPLNTILTRYVHFVAGVGPVATRLPPMFGFIVTSLLLFVFVRKRSNPLMGLTAALLPAYTAAWGYASEARGYILDTAFAHNRSALTAADWGGSR